MIRLLLVISALASSALAEDFSKISIQGAFYPFKASDPNNYSYYYLDESLTPSMEFGIRVKADKKVGVDFILSAMYNSGYEADIYGFTEYKPKLYTVSAKAGVIYDLYSRDRAALGALFYLGGVYKEHLLAWDYYYGYSTFTPVFFAGVEPSVELSKNFVFYTKFGLDIEKNPDTKGLVAVYDPYYGYVTGYMIAERNDANISVSLSGFVVGIRYQF